MESEERMRRNMEFIIEQQARFGQWQEENKKRFAESEERHKLLEQGMQRLANQQAATDERINRLTDAVLSLTNVVAKHEDRLDSLDTLSGTMAALAVKVDALVDAVARSVTGRGGQQ